MLFLPIFPFYYVLFRITYKILFYKKYQLQSYKVV